MSKSLPRTGSLVLTEQSQNRCKKTRSPKFGINLNDKAHRDTLPCIILLLWSMIMQVVSAARRVERGEELPG